MPTSDVPGETAWPTQPIPTGIATFARQELDRESLFGLTFLDRNWCRKRFDESRYDGLYTPPSERGSILFPSALGGGNWGGAAFDPGTNLLIHQGGEPGDLASGSFRRKRGSTRARGIT